MGSTLATSGNGSEVMCGSLSINNVPSLSVDMRTGALRIVPKLVETAHSLVHMQSHYARDTPGDVADFWLVSNSSREDCEIKIEGRSLFTVVK